MPTCPGCGRSGGRKRRGLGESDASPFRCKPDAWGTSPRSLGGETCLGQQHVTAWPIQPCRFAPESAWSGKVRSPGVSNRGRNGRGEGRSGHRGDTRRWSPTGRDRAAAARAGCQGQPRSPQAFRYMAQPRPGRGTEATTSQAFGTVAFGGVERGKPAYSLWGMDHVALTRDVSLDVKAVYRSHVIDTLASRHRRPKHTASQRQSGAFRVASLRDACSARQRHDVACMARGLLLGNWKLPGVTGIRHPDAEGG